MKYAVVTGASSGMGLEFARQLAERKYGIVIVSNQPEENRRVAEMLRRQNHVDVRVIDMDLTLPRYLPTGNFMGIGSGSIGQQCRYASFLDVGTDFA